MRELLGVGVAVEVDLGGSQVRMFGADHPDQAAQARLRELLLPLLMLPVLAPVLIASTEATAALLVPNPAMRWDWLGFLLAFDVVFLTALWLFGEYLLEE